MASGMKKFVQFGGVVFLCAYEFLRVRQFDHILGMVEAWIAVIVLDNHAG